jgi:hypothetical protein
MGRGIQGGKGTDLAAPRSRPAASNRRTAASRLSDAGNGFSTAMGFPRSVKTTSSPAFTDFTAFENR